MSRIDDLVAEMCPAGVEFRALGDVFAMKAGSAIPAAAIVDVPTDDFTVPCFGGNGIRGYTRSLSHTGQHLLIGRQGALCGNVKRVDGDFFATEHAVVISPKEEIDLDWAFHLLVKMDLNQYATKSAQPGLAVKNLQRVTMPVPPLEIQREIVSILDKMDKLQAELQAQLQAELHARSAQYTHYRQLILDRIDGDSVALLTLGKWQGGMTPSRSNPGYWESGTVPWLASMDISDTTTDEIRGRVTSLALEETSLRVVPAPSVAVVMRSNILRRVLPIGLIEVDTTVNQDVRALIPREGVDAEYVYQALQADRDRIRASCVRTDGSMAAVDSQSFFAWEIPLPSLVEQRRVARQLRRFDALVNDLSIGLPAEIAARRKQYEYYRDQLLTFPERSDAA